MGHLYWKHIGHEPYEIKHGRFSVGEGAIVSQCWKGVQHKTTPMAASLIAHKDIRYREEQQFKMRKKC